MEQWRERAVPSLPGGLRSGEGVAEGAGIIFGVLRVFKQIAER